MKSIRNFLFFSVMLLLLGSCEKSEDAGDINLEIDKPSEITETSFTLNWKVSHQNFHTIQVDFSLDRELEEIEESVKLTDTSLESLNVGNRRGATKYFYRLSIFREGSLLAESDIYAVETSYHNSSVSLLTSDEMNLSGKIAYLESNTGEKPGIILMHELGVFVNPWVDSPLLKLLVSEGYVCLTFFFRGHGSSSSIDDFQDLIDDKSLIASDLMAALDYMNNHDKVVSNKLGLIGASLGGIMALAGNGYESVKTSVSLSAPADGVFFIFPEMTISSAYYLCGELDIHPDRNADFPKDAKILYKNTLEPRKLTLVPGTSDHGTNLLTRDSLNLNIKEWILETLPLQ